MPDKDPNPAPQPGATATGDGTDGSVSPLPPAAAVIPQQPPAAGEPPGEPPPDYEKKFKGLQKIHQDLDARHKALLAEKDTLAAQMAAAQGSLEALQGQMDSLKTEKETSVAHLEGIQGELLDYQLWERKLERIRQTAPQLAQFEKYIIVDVPDELMADPTSLAEEQQKQLDAAIDAAIADFGKVMGDYVEQSVKAQHAGVVPPSSPGKGGQPTLESLYDMAVAAAGTDKYDEYMELYQKLAEKQLPGSEDELGLWRPTDRS